VIAGATKPEQVAANATGASWQLTESDLDEIDTVIANAKS
jgi:aryl-alcohol dehydrogenase-like predicted oxidoreductase